MKKIVEKLYALLHTVYIKIVALVNLDIKSYKSAHYTLEPTYSISCHNIRNLFRLKFMLPPIVKKENVRYLPIPYYMINFVPLFLRVNALTKKVSKDVIKLVDRWQKIVA